MYQIYNIIDPRDDHVFYVGATHNFMQRVAQHLRRTHTHVAERIQSMRACGVVPVFNILEQVPTSEQANEREKYWSHFFMSMGMHLLPGCFAGYPRMKAAGRKSTDLRYARMWVQWQLTGISPWRNPREMKKHPPKPEALAKVLTDLEQHLAEV